MEYGYDWLCDETRTIDDLKKLHTSIQLTIHGFLVNYQLDVLKTSQASTNLKDAFNSFLTDAGKKPPVAELTMRLKEQLALIAILLCDNEYGIPLNDEDDKKLVAAGGTD